MRKGSEIGRVRGLGSAHAGAGTWLSERVSGAATFATSLYVLFSLALQPAFDFKTMHEWVARPVPATLLALFVLANFWHARLGLKVVVEDYQQGAGTKFPMLLLIDAGTLIGTAFALVFLGRVALGGA